MLLLGAALRSGTAAGLATIPFAAVLRAKALRINEYGRKTLELLVGRYGLSRLREVLMFAQHLLISWLVALPLLLILGRVGGRRRRILAGAAYRSTKRDFSECFGFGFSGWGLVSILRLILRAYPQRSRAPGRAS